MSFLSSGAASYLRLLVLSAIAGTLSYFLMPLCYLAAGTIGAIDYPGSERRINSRPTPRLGGLGFFTAFFTALTLSGLNAESVSAALLAGGGILVAIGVSDDAISLPPAVKLIGQAAAALVALSFIPAPQEFSFFGLFVIPLPSILGLAFALFRIIFTINAVNFSDGLDGLAAGLSIVALSSLAIFGAANGREGAAIAAIFLTASLLGFIPFNKHRAKMFMGDSGSQFLGFAIAVLSLASSRTGSFTIETSFFIAIPVVDTWFSVTRRILKRKSPFCADKGHLHHLLLKAGLSHPVAVRVLVSSGALIALTALLFSI